MFPKEKGSNYSFDKYWYVNKIFMESRPLGGIGRKICPTKSFKSRKKNLNHKMKIIHEVLNEKNTIRLGIKFCGNSCLAPAVSEVFLRDPFY